MHRRVRAQSDQLQRVLLARGRLRELIEKNREAEGHRRVLRRELARDTGKRQRAAGKIQEFYRAHRGHLAVTERAVLDMKNEVNLIVHDTFVFSKCLKLKLGQREAQCAVFIQRAYRRHLFYLKICRLRTVFEFSSEIRRNHAELIVRNWVCKEACRGRVGALKQEKIITEKLGIVRRNLAVLTVKKHWKLQNCRIKSLILGIRRAKALRKQCTGNTRRSSYFQNRLNTRLYRRNVTFLYKEIHIENTSTENSNLLQHDLHREKLLENLKISHNVKPLKLRLIRPIPLCTKLAKYWPPSPDSLSFGTHFLHNTIDSLPRAQKNKPQHRSRRT